MIKIQLKYIAFLIVLVVINSACAVKKPPLPKIMLNPETAQEMKKYKGYWIEVQIPQRKLVLAKSNHIIKTFPIAVGQPGYPTPVGNRAINRVVWNPWWHPPKGSKWVKDSTPVPPRTPGNPLGEVKMPIGRAYLIHGTKAVRSIGRWASHGCIRMLFEDIFSLTQLLMTEYSKTSAIDSMEMANKRPHRQFTDKLDEEIPVVLNYDLVKVSNDYVIIAPDLYRRHKGRVAKHIAEVVAPHLKKDKIPSLKKINNLLKVFKGQTVMIALEDLEKNRDSSDDQDKKEKKEMKARKKAEKEKVKTKAKKEKEKEKTAKKEEKEKVKKEKEEIKAAKKLEEKKEKEEAKKEKEKEKTAKKIEKEKKKEEDKKEKEKEKKSKVTKTKKSSSKKKTNS